MSTVFDDRPCELGEGPLWHPERQQLFWFDIIGKRLMTRDGQEPHSWAFDEHVSAAGWVDRDALLLASETGLWRFDLNTADRSLITPLEADNPVTRSNDGRADPWGGLWIGTMGKEAEPGAGSISVLERRVKVFGCGGNNLKRGLFCSGSVGCIFLRYRDRAGSALEAGRGNRLA